MTDHRIMCKACQDGRHWLCREDYDCPCLHPTSASTVDANQHPPPDVDAASAVDGAVGMVFCHFAATDPGHTCATSFGRPLQAGQRCFHEARRRLFDDIEGTG